MTWSIHHVSLVAHDLDAAAYFFGTLIGLGVAEALDGQSRFIGAAGRGLRLHRPAPALARSGAMLLGPVGGRYVALEVASLAKVVAKLDQAGLAYASALPGEFAQPAIYTLDPALNLLLLLQADGAAPSAPPSWHIHHVNLQAQHVREAIAISEARIRADDMQPAIVIGLGQHGQFSGVYAEIPTLRRRAPAPFRHADDVCVKRHGLPHIFCLQVDVMEMPGRGR